MAKTPKRHEPHPKHTARWWWQIMRAIQHGRGNLADLHDKVPLDDQEAIDQGIHLTEPIQEQVFQITDLKIKTSLDSRNPNYREHLYPLPEDLWGTVWSNDSGFSSPHEHEEDN